jgi:hypothetical protein
MILILVVFPLISTQDFDQSGWKFLCACKIVREKFQVQKLEIPKFLPCQPLVECHLSIAIWIGHLCIELSCCVVSLLLAYA